jgi:2',3'-cyclic-nucleotide 2'-phosphodiesterase (5'-nucleotidase family)
MLRSTRVGLQLGALAFLCLMLSVPGVRAQQAPPSPASLPRAEPPTPPTALPSAPSLPTGDPARPSPIRPSAVASEKPEPPVVSEAPEASPAPHATERVVDDAIKDDAALEGMLAPYRARLRELDAVIGHLAGDLSKKGIGGGTLGTFVTDAIKSRSETVLGKTVTLALTNTGGLRKDPIIAGDLRVRDIFELLPFENALVTIDLTGAQLRQFMETVTTHRDAQSGAVVKYRVNAENKNEVTDVQLLSPRSQPIDPSLLYTIVTTDYLVKRGGDYAILQQGKNLHPVGITLRDAVIDYVKAESAAGRALKPAFDHRFVCEGDRCNPDAK